MRVDASILEPVDLTLSQRLILLRISVAVYNTPSRIHNHLRLPGDIVIDDISAKCDRGGNGTPCGLRPRTDTYQWRRRRWPRRREHDVPTSAIERVSEVLKLTTFAERVEAEGAAILVCGQLIGDSIRLSTTQPAAGLVGAPVVAAKDVVQEPALAKDIVEELTGAMENIPPRIAEIHRIVRRIAIPVRPHPRLGDLPPVGRGEQRQVGVVGAGVEALQAGGAVEALADIALVFGHVRGGKGLFISDGAEGAVGGAVVFGYVGQAPGLLLCDGAETAGARARRGVGFALVGAAWCAMNAHPTACFSIFSHPKNPPG